jgi:hypothetical protein
VYKRKPDYHTADGNVTESWASSGLQDSRCVTDPLITAIAQDWRRKSCSGGAHTHLDLTIRRSSIPSRSQRTSTFDLELKQQEMSAISALNRLRN